MQPSASTRIGSLIKISPEALRDRDAKHETLTKSDASRPKSREHVAIQVGHKDGFFRAQNLGSLTHNKAHTSNN